MLVMNTTFFDPEKFAAQEHLDFGCSLIQQNRFAEAIVEFDIALKLDPNERYARWDRAVALLSLGDYDNGFPEHENAWKIYDWRSLSQLKGNVDHILELPLWRGERCKLLVYHEMGFGDAIMLLRFLPDLVSRCDVTLVVQSELVSLMQGHGAIIVDCVPEVSEFDARISFFNSVHIMGHSLKTIPSVPYIKSDLKFNGGKMGIAWSGNARKELETTFLSYLDTHNFDLYSIQKTKVTIDNIISLQAKDFKETAALMMTLDCIVTVDTAAAHLAGAIGHPNTHLLLPYFRDWRWWRSEVWYPTIKIYPQETADDWSIPFARVNAALKG